MIVIEKEGKSVEAAVSLALEELNLSENEVNVEIVRKEGLFKTALVRVSPLKSKTDKAFDFVNEMLKLMKLNTKAELVANGEEMVINLVGEDNGIAIGYRGEALDAMQYLAMLAANKDGNEYFKVIVDAENYRYKRMLTLQNLAERLADKAIKSGRIVEVEPMNPYERKVFHTALSDNPNVKTESEGVEPNRYVVIIPVSNKQESVEKSDFAQRGIGKVKSFGAKRRKF